MSSREGKEEGSTHPELEEMLRQHDVPPELAQQIRELVGRVGDTNESGTRVAGVEDGTDAAVRPPSAEETQLSPLVPQDDVRSSTGRERPSDPVESTVVAGVGAVRMARLDTKSVTPRDPSLIPLALIASGGMGNVHRVRDLTLDRQLAMKSLHEHYARAPHLRSAFLDEARITAQLAHPSIPPVHALGDLSDGRPYFTMKEVHGRTLGEVIEELERLGELESPTARVAGWSEHRRLEVFQRVCEAVAYAHARGVIHCDIKPPNVMVGAFGEVLVMDWGVARLVAPSPQSTDEAPVRLSDRDGVTTVAGTPAYMAPEQATGDVDALGPASDVYSLGVVLYELMAGRRPYDGNPAQLLFFAASGKVPPIPRRAGSIVDDALFAIIVTAMAPAAVDRYPNAGALARDLAEWREGARKRERAVQLARDAEEILSFNTPEVDHVADLRRQAAEKLAALDADASLEARTEAWKLLEQAETIEESCALRTEEAVELLGAALVQAPENPEARSLLADIHYERHRTAVAARAWHEAERHELRIRAHDIGRYAEYLERIRRLWVSLDQRCDVTVHRFVSKGRRLVPEPVERRLDTDEIDLELEIGSYLLVFERDDGARVSYPVAIERGPRDGAVRTEVAIDEPLDRDGREILVPASLPELADRREAPIEAFVIQRDPVSFAEFAEFVVTPEGAPFQVGFLDEGIRLFAPNWPVVGVSWDAADRYALWYAERTGGAWRLPTEREWEKAASGADKRVYPFGDFIDPVFCRTRGAGRVPRGPCAVDRFAEDVSPYGVRGMAGNVRDWCTDRFDTSGLRAVRGGSWQRHADDARCRARAGLDPDRGYVDVGFRLVRSLGGRTRSD